jgi:ABC-type Fe3+ transport system substrate-binding protein
MRGWDGMRVLRAAPRLLSLGFLFFLFGCRSKNNAPELVILSPHSPEIAREFTLGFEGWYKARTGQGITLKWLNVGGTGEAVEYVKSRNDPKNPAGGVDLFFGGGDVPFFILERLGLLAPCRLPASILARIPEELSGVRIYSRDSLWYGSALSTFGILANRAIATRSGFAVPERWEDLARPEYFGWISSGDPRYGGTLHIMYEIILQSYGWEKGWEILLKIGANSRSFEKSASIVAKDVALGESAFGLCIDFYAFSEIDRYGADRLEFVLPVGETIVTPDGIGLLKNAKQPQAARLFIEYALSEGQKLWVLKKGQPGGPVHQSLCRMPVDSTLYALDASKRSVTLSPLGFKTLAYNSRLSGQRWGIVNDLAASVILSPHRELKACRKALMGKKIAEDGLRGYLSIGVSEPEALKLSAQWGQKENALERIKIMNAWTVQAKARYDSARR